ncbi:class I SAM-dependent methyltransferase [Clostridium sp. UBA7503]|uniref:class I SAM-dependent methyltransferase n=1 Tax=Clostridium sp. UBA7503 TaxID=1946377 RepID=UPI0032162793
MKETWKQIWLRKGMAEGSIEDMLAFDGYEKTKIDMKQVAMSIIKELDIKKDDRVLEVGCGAGALAQYLQCDYVGVDYSPTLVKKHIKFLENSVLTGEADNLIFKDKTFDKVIAYGIFMYFNDKEYAQRAISEFKRVAKKGILLGDLPMKSHNSDHLLFSKEEFEGWKITEGFYDPYRDKRFNATMLMESFE